MRFQSITMVASLAMTTLACSPMKNFKMTFYGYPDNSPPGAEVRYNCGGRNNKAAGTGTYENPLTMAAEAGQLQLNAFEPIIVHSLSESLMHLTNACTVLAERCVDGISANVDVMSERVANSIGLATALNPLLGYLISTQVAQEAQASGRSVKDIVLDHGYLTAEQLTQALAPERLANLR